MILEIKESLSKTEIEKLQMLAKKDEEKEIKEKV